MAIDSGAVLCDLIDGFIVFLAQLHARAMRKLPFGREEGPNLLEIRAKIDRITEADRKIARELDHANIKMQKMLERVNDMGVRIYGHQCAKCNKTCSVSECDKYCDECLNKYKYSLGFTRAEDAIKPKKTITQIADEAKNVGWNVEMRSDGSMFASSSKKGYTPVSNTNPKNLKLPTGGSGVSSANISETDELESSEWVCIDCGAYGQIEMPCSHCGSVGYRRIFENERPSKTNASKPVYLPEVTHMELGRMVR